MSAHAPAPIHTQTNPHPWYGILTRSNQEKLACLGLEERGYQPFLPVYKCRRRWTDRVVNAELPLFPGYIFCQFDHRRRLPVVTAPGVAQIVGCGQQPAPIPESEIEAIRTVVTSGLSVEPAPFLRAGQRVRVTYGPLKNVEGTLLLKKSFTCLVVSIEMLQRSVSVEIDPAHLGSL